MKPLDLQNEARQHKLYIITVATFNHEEYARFNFPLMFFVLISTTYELCVWGTGLHLQNK